MKALACIVLLSVVGMAAPIVARAGSVGLVYRGLYNDEDSTNNHWGHQQVRGANLALKYFGELFPRVHATIQHFEYSGKSLSILSALQRAKGQGVKMLAGAAWSNDVLEAAEFIANNRMHLVSSMASSGKLARHDRLISAMPSNAHLVRALLRQLLADGGICRKFGVVYAADSEYALDLLRILKAEVPKRLGAQRIVEFPVLTDNDGWRAARTPLQGNMRSNDCLFLALHEYESGRLVSYLAASFHMPLLLATDGLGKDGALFWTLIPENRRHHVRGYAVFPWDAQGGDALQLEFERRYQTQFGKKPDGLSYFTFRSMLVALIVQHSGCQEQLAISECVAAADVRRQLRKSGITFSKAGFAHYPLAILRLENGQHKMHATQRGSGGHK